MDINRIIKEYYEQLFAHVFDNLDEMDQFLERHRKNRLISIKEPESIINNLP